MTRINVIVAACVLSWLVPQTSAGEKAVVPASETLARFFDARTFCVLSLDVKQVDLEGLLRSSLVGGDSALWKAALKSGGDVGTLVQWFSQLRDVGVKRCDVILRFARPRDAGLVVLTLSDNADRLNALEKLRESALRLGGGQQAEGKPFVAEIGPFIAIGPRDVVEQARESMPEPQPELAAALSKEMTAPIRLVLALSADQRRVLHELLPRWANEAGGEEFQLDLLWRGIRSVSIAYQPHPPRSLKVVMQLTDESKAAETADLLKHVYRQMAALPALKAAMPKLPEALKLLSPNVDGDRLVIVLDQQGDRIARFQSMLFAPATVVARKAAARTTAMNRMKQILLAFHNSASARQQKDKSKGFLDAFNRDRQGKPLLSWRVHLLRYLEGDSEQAALYNSFHLDEPWDSPHNRKLIKKMPAAYAIPGSAAAAEGRTCFQVVVGLEAMFPDGRGRALREVRDGLSNTIMLVEVDEKHAVPWTQPTDWKYDKKNPKAGLGGHLNGGFLAALADGSVHFLSDNLDAGLLNALLTCQGAEPVAAPWK